MLHRRRRRSQGHVSTGLWLSAMIAAFGVNFAPDLHPNAPSEDSVVAAGHADQPPLHQLVCLFEQILGGECTCDQIPDPPPPPPMPEEPPT